MADKEGRDPTRERVWYQAWNAVAGVFNCTNAATATRWADEALKAFDARFRPDRADTKHQDIH